MLNTLWKTLAALAAAAVFGLSVWVARLRHRQQEDKAEREAAQVDQIKRASEHLEATRQRYSNQAPVDPGKRTDFEGK